jgi:hypothetical protein
LNQIPQELDKRRVTCYIQMYEFMGRIDALVITTWDDPTPWAGRKITSVPSGEVISTGSGFYFRTYSEALQWLKSQMPW